MPQRILSEIFGSVPDGLPGEICHCMFGGGVPHEEEELVLRRCPGPNPWAVEWGIENCTAGGDIWHMSGMAIMELFLGGAAALDSDF